MPEVTEYFGSSYTRTAASREYTRINQNRPHYKYVRPCRPMDALAPGCFMGSQPPFSVGTRPRTCAGRQPPAKCRAWRRTASASTSAAASPLPTRHRQRYLTWTQRTCRSTNRRSIQRLTALARSGRRSCCARRRRSAARTPNNAQNRRGSYRSGVSPQPPPSLVATAMASAALMASKTRLRPTETPALPQLPILQSLVQSMMVLIDE